MTDTTDIEPKASSTFVRTVGKTTLEVVNTKQRPTDVTVKAKQSKWAVIEYNGKTKKLLHAGDKKYPAIAVLRAREIALKADAVKSTTES